MLSKRLESFKEGYSVCPLGEDSVDADKAFWVREPPPRGLRGGQTAVQSRLVAARPLEKAGDQKESDPKAPECQLQRWALFLGKN